MIDRRKFLFQAAAGGLSIFAFGSARAAKSPKQLIVLWMEGGPSQLDTFDPKPGTATGGPFAAIETAVSGVRIAETLPRIAAEMKSIALVRSVVSREGNHPRARHLLHTGYAPGGGVRHPSLGSVVAHELASNDDPLPAFVSIGGLPIGSGFLGAASSPFFVAEAGGGNEHIVAPAHLDAERLARRAKLVDTIDASFVAR